MNVNLILAASLRPLCFPRNAASPFVRVSFTVSVVALGRDFLLALDKPLPRRHQLARKWDLDLKGGGVALDACV